MKSIKALGQHFLHDEQVIHKICACIPRNISKCTEIGPGTGHLTRSLLRMGLEVRCIELDARFTPVPNTNWIRADALQYQYQKEDWIVGNLPYNISTALLTKLCSTQIAGWTVMVQKEVADRIIATAGKNYGCLSVIMQTCFDIRHHFYVPPECFRPRPQVHSAVISGTRINTNCDLDKLTSLTRTLFRHRRKQLRTSIPTDLLQSLQRTNPGIDVEKMRPEEVTLAQIISMLATY